MSKTSVWTAAVGLGLCLSGPECLAAGPYTETVQVVTSAPASSAPAATAVVGAGMKLVGGGVRTNFNGFGSLLTVSYPYSPTSWAAAAKDHLSPDPSTVTTYAVGINDPTDDWEVGVFPSPPSAVASHPVATANLPAGQNWVLTGGGCVDNWAPSGAWGNLLTASFPSSNISWECRGKDHSVASPAAITAFVIGIRPKRAGIPLPTVQITTATSAVADLPEVVAPTVPGALVTGGGALAAPSDPNGAGQLLTGTYPEVNATGTIVGWHARSKDHAVVSPGTVTAFAVNVTFPQVAFAPIALTQATVMVAPPNPAISSLSVANGQPKDLITIYGSGFGEAGGTVHFVLGPGIDVPATIIPVWHDTHIDVNVPEKYGIAAPYAGLVYVVRKGDTAQSLPKSFEFDPAYELVELPWPGDLAKAIFRAPNNFGFTAQPPIVPHCTYGFQGGPCRWAEDKNWLFGWKADDEYYVGQNLVNGWTVADVQIRISSGYFPEDTAASIANSPIGSNSPHVVIHCWANPGPAYLDYYVRIWIRGPKGVPPF